MSKSTSPALPDLKRWGLPLIVFVLALGLRLMGIGWGLPNARHQESYHPDEGPIWAYSQAIEPTKLQFTPSFYNYGTFYLTTLKIASDMTAAYTGGGLDPHKPENAWAVIGKAQFAGRIISALAGAGTALIVFLILRRFSTDFGAMFGGLLVAFAPAHVVHSRFQTVDILAAFFIAASAFYALKLIRQEGVEEKLSDIKLAILSGVFAGLSAGTKYTGILCLVTLFVVVFGTRGKPGIKLALAGLIAAIAVFLITTPGILLETKIFLEGFMFETQHVKAGHGLVFEGTSSGFIYHLANLAIGIGLILSVLGLGGLFGGAAKKHWWAIALGSFFLVYYLLIAGAEVKFIRYTFPLFIGMGVGFGWLMGRAREKGGKWHGLVGLGLLGLGGVFGGGLMSAMKFTAWMASPDPREKAGAYLSGKDVTVGLVSDPWFYTPSFNPELGRRLQFEAGMPFAVNRMYGPSLDRVMGLMSQPRIVRYVPLGPDGSRDVRSRRDWDERLLTEYTPDYVAYSSFESENLERIAQLANPSEVGKATADRAKAFMDRLKKDYVFDSVYGPNVDTAYGKGQDLVHDLMYVQPTVWIWKRKAAP